MPHCLYKFVALWMQQAAAITVAVVARQPMLCIPTLVCTHGPEQCNQDIAVPNAHLYVHPSQPSFDLQQCCQPLPAGWTNASLPVYQLRSSVLMVPNARHLPLLRVLNARNLPLLMLPTTNHLHNTHTCFTYR
jgi:hypothetical protein